MPRQKQNPTVGVNLEPELHAALVEFAENNTAGNVSEALRQIIQDKFVSGGFAGLEASLEASGYNAGLRQGVSEARRAIAQALNGLWRK